MKKIQFLKSLNGACEEEQMNMVCARLLNLPEQNTSRTDKIHSTLIILTLIFTFTLITNLEFKIFFVIANSFFTEFFV